MFRYYVISQSESGDYFLIPREKKDSFLEDELAGIADYGISLGCLEDLLIIDFELSGR